LTDHSFPACILRCDECDDATDLRASTDPVLVYAQMTTFLAAHIDCNRFSISMSAPRSNGAFAHPPHE
jgi:hypothetical protein